jgi:hypothetical protein
MTEVVSNLSLISRLESFVQTLKVRSKSSIYKSFNKTLPNHQIAGLWFLILKKSAEIKNQPESLKRLLEISDHDLCHGKSGEKKTNLKKFLKLIDQVVLDLSQEKTTKKSAVVENQIKTTLQPYFKIEFLSYCTIQEKLEVERKCLDVIDKIKQSKILNFDKCLLDAHVAFGTKSLLVYLQKINEDDEYLEQDLTGFYYYHNDILGVVTKSFSDISILIHEFSHRFFYSLKRKQKKELKILYKKVSKYKNTIKGFKKLNLKDGDLMPNYYAHSCVNQAESFETYDSEDGFSDKKYLKGYNYFPSRYAKNCFGEWFAEMCTMTTLNQNNVKDWNKNKFLKIVNQGNLKED